MRRELWRWLLVAGLCVGLVAGIGLVYHVGWVQPVRAERARVEQEIEKLAPAPAPDPEAEARRARQAAIAACRREPLGGGTVDDQIERRIACLSRHGYRG
jgi:hypothetical protein